MHPCTVDDVATVLGMIAPQDLEGLKLIIFRQPTRKQATISPVWGRLRYFMEIGRHRGGALILEAGASKGALQRFPRKMHVDDEAELERFRANGQTIVEDRRSISVVLDMTAQRRCNSLGRCCTRLVTKLTISKRSSDLPTSKIPSGVISGGAIGNGLRSNAKSLRTPMRIVSEWRFEVKDEFHSRGSMVRNVCLGLAYVRRIFIRRQEERVRHKWTASTDRQATSPKEVGPKEPQRFRQMGNSPFDSVPAKPLKFRRTNSTNHGASSGLHRGCNSSAC
jgi:hypothetical protein